MIVLVLDATLLFGCGQTAEGPGVSERVAPSPAPAAQTDPEDSPTSAQNPLPGDLSSILGPNELCVPEGDAPHAAVIYLHGGSDGAVRGDPDGTCEALAAAGYVGIAPIRYSNGDPAVELPDILSLVDAVEAADFVDPDRVATLGFSRGALLAYMAATERPELAGQVLAAPAANAAALATYLPKASEITGPTAVLVAENDTVQADHVASSRDVAAALESAGAEVELIVYPPYGRDGHSLFFDVGAWWPDVLDFLAAHI